VSPNQKAFLDMIAVSEGTAHLGDNGYNVLVGGTLFHGYSDHPHQIVSLNPHLASSAAGRYQLLMRYFDVYKKQLGLKDFSPASQDAIALQQIKECHALDAIEEGDIVTAIEKCAHIWASLPGAGYGQHENKLAALEAAYVAAGGTLA
jgi:muramidase (phage lysozyme)